MGRIRLLDVEVPPSTTELVRAAAEGDERSWELLVKRYGGRVWSIVQAHRLTDSDALDVVKITWLHLAQHLKRIREPEATGAWLATIAKRECERTLRRAAARAPRRWGYGSGASAPPVPAAWSACGAE